MGIGTLKVAPELLGALVAGMPKSCAIVGTDACDELVALRIEAEFVPYGSMLRYETRHRGLSVETCLVICE